MFAIGDRELLEGDTESDAIDFSRPLRGEDRDNLVGKAESEDSLLRLDRKTGRVLSELVDANLIERLDIDQGLLKSDASA